MGQGLGGAHRLRTRARLSYLGLKLARRIAIGVGVLIAVWFVALVIIDVAYEDRYGERVADRIGDTLKGEGSMADSDLALVRGTLDLGGMHVARADDAGKLTLDVREVHCELLPLGGALFDRDCRVLSLAGMRLEASSLELFKLQPPKRPPMHAYWVTIDDAVFVIESAGNFGRGELTLAHVEAGTTTFRTPLSWIFNLGELRARVVLPVPFGTVDIAYRYGVLSISGGIFAAKPWSKPIALPVQDLSDTPQQELARIVAWALPMLKDAINERLPPWLRFG